MILLDEGGQDFVFENQWDIAIPISIELLDGREARIEVFPKLEHIAREFCERFAQDMLSDAALEWLWDAVKPYAREWGYSDDKFRDRWGYIFRADAADAANDAADATNDVGGAAKDGVTILYGTDAPSNRTTLDIEYCLTEGHAAAVICDGGEIVSAAMTHEPIDELIECGHGLCEIGVETAPEYRGRGYARCAVAALSAFLKEKGLTAEYRCQRYNKASYKVAQSAGMKVCGRFYSYILRKNT